MERSSSVCNICAISVGGAPWSFNQSNGRKCPSPALFKSPTEPGGASCGRKRPYARRNHRQRMSAQNAAIFQVGRVARAARIKPMPDALELLKTRRSIKPVELAGPAPSAAEIETLLTIASRVPDHGKLVPWRFIVFEGEARLAAGEAIVAAFCAKYPQAKPEHIEAERHRLAR